MGIHVLCFFHNSLLQTKLSYKHLNAKQVKLLILTLNKSVESIGRRGLSSDTNNRVGHQTSEIMKSCGFAFIYLLIRKLNDISIATGTISMNTGFMPAITHSRVYRNGSLRSELGKAGKY